MRCLEEGYWRLISGCPIRGIVGIWEYQKLVAGLPMSAGQTPGAVLTAWA